MPSQRHYKRARFLKLQLQLELGAFCKVCGSEDNLEFDCIKPQGDRHHKMNSCDRVYFYLKQHGNRNVQILCNKCHERKTSDENRSKPMEEVSGTSEQYLAFTTGVVADDDPF